MSMPVEFVRGAKTEKRILVADLASRPGILVTPPSLLLRDTKRLLQYTKNVKHVRNHCRPRHLLIKQKCSRFAMTKSIPKYQRVCVKLENLRSRQVNTG